MTTPAAPQTNERVRALANDIAIVETAAGSVLVNSPPETLKFILAAGLLVPGIVLLPPDVPPGQQLGSRGFVRHGLNYASVEFLLYSNFFVGGGRRTRLITPTEAQARRLRCILEETIDGPSDPAEYMPHDWLLSECRAVAHFPPLGRAPAVADLAEITSLEAGGELGDGVAIHLADDHFEFYEAGVLVARVSAQAREAAVPLTLAPPCPVSRHEITLQFIGGSDGFDPNGITTCFLAYLGATGHSRATLFDAAAYLRLRLGNLGIAPSQISEVVLSHLHEDHLAGLPELLLLGEHRVRLLTSGLIYHSLLRVLAAMLAVSETEAQALFDYYPLEPGRPLMLEGRRFESIYAIHSIPTLAVRANSLCYSGDMRYDEAWFEELEQDGVLSEARRAELTSFAEGATILVQDAGGGAIHTTLTPETLAALAAKSQRVVFAHTSQPRLPAGHTDMLNRKAVEFAASGHVTHVGEALPRAAEAERLETLSACPLFARLPVAERAALAGRAALTRWAPGQIIVREGEPSDGTTYVVHAGLVEARSGEQVLRLLGRGHSIGERGALQGERRLVTLAALGEVELLGLTPDVFRPVAETLGLKDAFNRADWLWQHPTFGHLPWATLLDLALDFQTRHYEPGDMLFRHGEPGYECYLLVSGAVAILDQDGEQIGAFSAPGEFLGGRAVLFGAPRNASGRVLAPSEFWALPAPALQRLQMVYPNVLLHLRVVEAKRLGIRPLLSALEGEAGAQTRL